MSLRCKLQEKIASYNRALIHVDNTLSSFDVFIVSNTMN